MNHLDAAINLSRNGRFAEALTALRPSTIGEGQRNAVELMRAELLERTGQYAEAERRAEMLLRSRSLTAEQRSLCEWILGRIDADQGLFESATKHLGRSASVALSAKLFERASWAQCKLMLIAADANGPDSVGPMFSELRQSVMRCASPHALANLHLAVSQMEGKRSLPGSVFRHAQVALRLLAESPNVWLEAMAEGNLVVAAILRPDFQKALTHARRAAELAERSGWRTGYAAALANLGIVSYLIGDFDEAVGHCERALTLFLPGSDEFSGTLDTLARLRLAQNRIDECEDLLSRIDYLNPLPDHQTRYVYRHASLTRIRVLMVKERYDEALLRLETLISLANNARDSSMFESAKLTKAQVFIRLGRLHEALAILRNSGATLRDQSPDVQSMYNIVVAAAFATVGDTEPYRDLRRAVNVSHATAACS